MSSLHTLNNIPITLPERQIWSRLGCNHHLTKVSEEQRTIIMRHIHDAFKLCRPRGVWRMMPLEHCSDEAVHLTGDAVFRSRALASLFGQSSAVWLAAATIGPELPDAIRQRYEDKDGVAALVYDAVGGETADAVMDWLQELTNRQLRRTGQNLTMRRFSPGYSDLDLTAQRTIFKLLDLESWGLQLTEKYIMVPEKSVTAIAGVESH